MVKDNPKHYATSANVGEIYKLKWYLNLSYYYIERTKRTEALFTTKTLRINWRMSSRKGCDQRWNVITYV